MKLKSTSAIALLTVAILAAATTPASAGIAFTLSGYTVNGHTEPPPGLAISASNLLSPDFNFTLEELTPVTVNLFRIWTNETSVDSDDLPPGDDISVAFSFSAPDAFGGTLEGDSYATRGRFGFLNLGTFVQGEVHWDAPLVVPFGTGGLLQIGLSDEIFNRREAIIFFPGLNNGFAGGAIVEATFTLLQAPTPLEITSTRTTISNPEPASLVVWTVGALIGVGYRHRRRKVA